MASNFRPVFIVPDYQKVDGRNTNPIRNTQLQMGLSDNNEAVFRLGEEDGSSLPLHRIADMALVTKAIVAYMGEAYRFPHLYDKTNPCIGRIGLQGDAMSVMVATDNPTIEEDIALLRDVLTRDAELLGERLRGLSQR